MFWKKKLSNKPDPPPAKPVSLPPVEQHDSDRALDTLAVFLRAMGQHAFDVDELEASDVQQKFEDWASQILVGKATSDDEGDRPPSLKRDWGGVRRFFTEHRKGEREYVTRTLGDLLQTVQTFAVCLTTTMKEDRSADSEVGNQLQRLSLALDDNETANIRSEAVATVNLVSKTMEERRTRQESQVRDLQAQLQSVRKELSEAREQMSVDPLTQLFNRASLDHHVEKLSDLGLLLGAPPAILMIDIDHFKKVNDELGHPAGDQVLRQVANCLLRNFLRKEDFVARYGGEEFAVVIAEPSLEAVTKLAERALDSVRRLEIEAAGRTVDVTVSIGVGQLLPGEPAEDWFARADRALYSAKERGRDRVVVAEAPEPLTSWRPAKRTSLRAASVPAE